MHFIKCLYIDQIKHVYVLYRVKSGECYHIYTKAREMTFAQYPLPEMLRTRLEEVILQIKILQLGKVKDFLSTVMDPPDLKAIDLSLELLQILNALDKHENLTPLGYHLAHLPLDPRTGNFIIAVIAQSTCNFNVTYMFYYRKNDSVGRIIFLCRANICYCC